MIVTIDVERDSTNDWRTPADLSFRSVTEAIPNRLIPIFERFKIRPTYLLSPEVITNTRCCDVLRMLPNCELGTHLHADYVVPHIKTWDLEDVRIQKDDMQWEYPPEIERAKLGVLTELFVQQFECRPRSFRAGRFGIGQYTGKWLIEQGYLLDSSVTPHIIWRNRHGIRNPDFRSSPEKPYTISSTGDIWKQGTSYLLEVPVTILQPGSLPSKNSCVPIWFRPWYSDGNTMCSILQLIASQPSRNGVTRPLVMMFHSVELVPGASPYPQTESEIIRYLEILNQVFQLASEMRIKSCTLEEYYHLYFEQTKFSAIVEIEKPKSTTPVSLLASLPRHSKPRSLEQGKANVHEKIKNAVTGFPLLYRGMRKTLKILRNQKERLGNIQSYLKSRIVYVFHSVVHPYLKKEILISPSLVDPILEYYQVQDILRTNYRERAAHWEIWRPSIWIVRHFPSTAKILEMGCGVGFNLMWLAEHGMDNLYGFDIDIAAISAGVEICEKKSLPVQLWSPKEFYLDDLPLKYFSVIIAWNRSMHTLGLRLDQFIDFYLNHLEKNGVFMFEVINPAYNHVSKNQLLIPGANKSKDTLESIDYRISISEADVQHIVWSRGLRVIKVFHEKKVTLRKIFVVGKV